MSELVHKGADRSDPFTEIDNLFLQRVDLSCSYTTEANNFFHCLLEKFLENGDRSGFLNNYPMICDPVTTTYILKKTCWCENDKHWTGVFNCFGFVNVDICHDRVRILFFEAFITKVGHGTKILDLLQEVPECKGKQFVADNPLEESVGFWKKMGIPTEGMIIEP